MKKRDEKEKRNVLNFPGFNDESYLESKRKDSDPEEEREPLPTGIKTLVIKRVAGAIIVGLLTLVFTIMTKNPRALFGLVVVAYLVYLAVSVVQDFRKERIIELPVMCTSCTISTARKIVSSTISPSSAKSTVVFRTLDEEPSYYTFIVPGNRTEEIQPNVTYVIYFNENNPTQLLGCVQL